MRIRNLSLLMAGVLLLCLLTGCARQGVFSEEQTASCLHVVCDEYSGQRSCHITVGENTCISVRCVYARKDGKLNVLIADESGFEAYRGDGINSNADFTVQLNNPGTYTISVDAENYSGKFLFDWETIGAVS